MAIAYDRVFTRASGLWTWGDKLVSSGTVGKGVSPFSVALSGDGKTAIVGGVGDDYYSEADKVTLAVGAAWVFSKP